MKSCREVTSVVLDGTLDDAWPWQQMAVRLHLMMCRHCGAFRRYIRALSESARRSFVDVTSELPPRFAATLASRLRSTVPHQRRDSTDS